MKTIKDLYKCALRPARPRALATMKLAAPVRHGRTPARLARPFRAGATSRSGVARIRSIGSRSRGSLLIFRPSPAVAPLRVTVAGSGPPSPDVTSNRGGRADLTAGARQDPVEDE